MTVLTGGQAACLEGVLSGEGPLVFLANRLRTIEVGVALSLTGVAGPVGVRGRCGVPGRSSYGFAGGVSDTEERSMIVLRVSDRTAKQTSRHT